MPKTKSKKKTGANEESMEEDDSKDNSNRMSAIKVSKSEMHFNAPQRPALIAGNSSNTELNKKEVDGAVTSKKDREKVTDLKTE